MKLKNKDIQFKYSIRVTLALYTIFFILLSLFSVVLLNFLFMEPFYVRDKSKTLETGMHLLEATKDLKDVDTSDALFSYCSINNLVFVVTDGDNNFYCNARSGQGELLASRLFGYVTGIDDSRPDILDSTDSYTIQKNKDIFTAEKYIEIWGALADGRSFLIRSPMASIRESVEQANTFFARVGLIMALVAGIVVWMFTKRITRPITELTEISQKMAALDFNTKYVSGGRDEIGVLGRNFNRMSEELERTISELKSANLELQKDIEKKEQIDEMRKDFLSNVSHELKTPIALIQGYAEGLQDNISDDPESRDFYCEVIIDEASKMNTMVKKLLTLNQLEFGNEQVALECFDLTALLRGVLQSVRIMVEQKGVQVRLRQEEPLYVWGDEFKVEEVITNYVSNALNHIDGERILDIRCRLENGRVRASVFNTGAQIPEEDIDKVWIKFFKVDKARTREYGGSGIGLSIVKAIMESLKQECGVENYSNGVEFWFTLEAAVDGKQIRPAETSRTAE